MPEGAAARSAGIASGASCRSASMTIDHSPRAADSPSQKPRAWQGAGRDPPASCSSRLTVSTLGAVRTIGEDHEAIHGELKAANEAVLSGNKELQSTNEELETAKEELQSSNEELTTLNEELQSRNSELTAVNNDLLNVLGNVTIPVVIVGQDLQIRRFTTPAQKLLNLLPSDVGRRLSDIRPNLLVGDLGQIANESIENVTTLEREAGTVCDAEGRLSDHEIRNADASRGVRSAQVALQHQIRADDSRDDGAFRRSFDRYRVAGRELGGIADVLQNDEIAGT